MKNKLADEVKPQAKLLVITTLLTIGLWFIPYAEYLVYPIRLFVTFIHESSHALVALVTGGAVQSLTIAADGSGVVYSAPSGFIGQIFTSSAGYLGTTAFGVLMLFLMRKNVASQKVLFCIGAAIGLITVVFGIIFPVFNFLSLNVPFSSVAFTVAVGLLLSAGLIVLALYASEKVSNFVIAFLAIQCLLNSLSDLKTLFFLNAPLVGSDISNDARNKSDGTSLPGIGWVILWIVISVVMISVGMRIFAVAKGKGSSDIFFDE